MNPQVLKIVSIHPKSSHRPEKPSSLVVMPDTMGTHRNWIGILGADSAKKSGKPPGFWGEDITTDGIDTAELKPLDCLISGKNGLRIMVTSGKGQFEQWKNFENHKEISLPPGGVYARIKKRIILKNGMEFIHKPKVFNVMVFTMSDRAFHGIYDDKSGKTIKEAVSDFFHRRERMVKTGKIVIPDDKKKLKKEFIRAVKNQVDILFITGGTGIGRRDITPETIRPLLDKEIPGIMESIRIKYGAKNPNALISRTFAGVRGKTLVYALPGSEKAVKEYLQEIKPTLFHSLYMVHDIPLHS